jgi:threonylcarbamoyladenosine tRNA methylthiotransferase MtaB
MEPKPLTDPCSPEPNLEAIEALLSALSDLPRVRNGRAKIMVENIKACLVTPEAARIMGRYLKGTTIHIGLETGDPEYNRLIGKPITPQQVYRAARLLKEAGLRPYVYLMYGLPLMRYKTYRRTLTAIEKLREIGVEKITLYKFTPLPYTAFSRLHPSIRGFTRIIGALKRRVEKYNLEMKRRLIGRRIKALLLAEKDRYYAYPFSHGPVIFVEKKPGLEEYSGCLIEVEVNTVYPRHVKGRFTRLIDC